MTSLRDKIEKELGREEIHDDGSTVIGMILAARKDELDALEKLAQNYARSKLENVKFGYHRNLTELLTPRQVAEAYTKAIDEQLSSLEWK